jgi:hypothetical protein
MQTFREAARKGNVHVAEQDASGAVDVSDLY